MKKYSQFILAVGAVFALTPGAFADPIGTRGGQCYTSLWVSAEETDCDQVCRRRSLSAESMTLSSASTQKVFVCRHKGRTSYAFGSQGSKNCQIIDGGTPRKRTTYECLCVRASCRADDSKRPGRRPDPDEKAPKRMSEKACLIRLEATIKQMRTQPNKSTYARAQRYCARGNLRGAISVIKEEK